jgi:zinc protease
VGDFDPAQLGRWVDDYFGKLARPADPIPRVTTKEPPRAGERTVRESSPKPPLPAFAVTWLAPDAASNEARAFEVLARVLAGGESSRLYRTLVYEKELAQSVEFTADLRADLGLLTGQLILASGVPIEKARAAFLAEIERLAAEPVPERELTTAKNQLLASKLRERETCNGKAFALGYAAAILGDATRANRELDELQAVTAAQVQAIAKEWLTAKNRLVIEYLPK